MDFRSILLIVGKIKKNVPELGVVEPLSFIKLNFELHFAAETHLNAKNISSIKQLYSKFSTATFF